MPQGEKKDISKETTVIFVDWDDTLLCSSFLSGAGYRLDSVMEGTSTLDKELKDLEASVISLLRLAMSFGDVHVVTNAETGWVQLSAKKFLPGVVPLLDRIKVLSARSTYESMFPDSPIKWKFCAFQERLNTDSKSPKNVISFGDSHVEREAIRAVTRGLPNTKTKSVKFAEKPSMEQLRRQLELVVNCFQYIHGHESDLDLQLTVTVNKKSDTDTTEAGEGTSKDLNSNSKSKEDGKQATPSPPAQTDPEPALKT
jgi:hypothetical protein